MPVVIPPPPPADAPRPEAEFDTECFPNYWLLKLQAEGGPVHTIRLYAGQRMSAEDVRRLDLLFDAYCAVSFNGFGYDCWMIGCARAGYTPEQLKAVNDQIIVEKIKPWELGLPRWEPSDHIDIREVVPGGGGQKLCAARLHRKRIIELPFSPDAALTPEQIPVVDAYCENDLSDLRALKEALRPQIEQRVALSKRYGIDLRSKSDAQVAEAVLRKRCEDAAGSRLYKRPADPFLAFHYRIPPFISYATPQLQHALEQVRRSVFRLSEKMVVLQPAELKGLVVQIGEATYQMGIGGLHSQEKRTVHRSDDTVVLRDNDVASYYPTLILNSGEWPAALGQQFLVEYTAIKDERLAAKALQAKLKKAGDTASAAAREAKAGNEGGKIMINGTFGKTNEPNSILNAPQMFVQTVITGQLSLLMLIEWHHLYGIPTVSANTDGFVIKCPRHLVHVSEALIAEWQRRTGLEMETVEYKLLASRDVNTYVAVKADGEVKRKGEMATAFDRNGAPDLQTKKNPDVEICAEAAAEFLASGTPVEYTIAACRDIRKFITMQNVAAGGKGGMKLWGEGPLKDELVRNMIPRLEAHGWVKQGRQWAKDGLLTDARSAYATTFAPQRPELLGKVCRWYYSTQAPGPIVYAGNGNTVSLSYGAMPCQTLPDAFPSDIDYAWYIGKAKSMLRDLGAIPQ